MYCKKCKTVLKEGEVLCESCSFDNTNAYNYVNELEKILNEQHKKKKKKPIIPIIVLLILLTIGIITLYLIKDIKTNVNDKKLPVTTTQNIDKLKKFKFEKILLKYPTNFGSSKNTIFYKNNSSININVKSITADEYTNIINANDCLDSKIGTLDTKTFANENSYSYIFLYKDLYYDITVNYVNDTTIYTEEIGLTISKIINSIELK